MKILIDIKTDNAAFEDNPNELRDILERVVYKICTGQAGDVPLRDSNGNTIGKFKVTGK